VCPFVACVELISYYPRRGCLSGAPMSKAPRPPAEVRAPARGLLRLPRASAAVPLGSATTPADPPTADAPPTASDSTAPSPRLPLAFGARLGRAADPKPPRPTPKPTVTASIPLIHGQGICTPHSDTDTGIMLRQQGRRGNPHGPWWQHELPELFRWGALIAATGVALTCVCSWMTASQPVRACPACSRSRSAYTDGWRAPNVSGCLLPAQCLDLRLS
jgi:hypothetical protein